MIQVDIFVVLAQILNILILFGVFYYFFGKKFAEAVETRKNQLKKLEKAQEHYNELIALAETQKQILLEEAQKTSRSLMKESERIAQAKAEALMLEANARVFAIIEGGQKQIEKERKSMLTQMKSHILDVSLRLNQKMFGNVQENKEFIEKEFERMK
jgi:F-type H+-transporting ATPase subunit b